MYIIGKVRDPKVADRIQLKLKEQGIEMRVHYDQSEDMHLLLIERKEDIEASFEVYRVAVGMSRPMEVSPEIERLWQTPRGPLTSALMGISIAVFILLIIPMFSRDGTSSEILDYLMIDQSDEHFFQEILGGQFWRLITPVFLHFSLLHILFNMMWLKDLGKIYEYQRGTLSFSLFFLFCAILSNLGQYMVQGPYFGGMSGVVFGLLGHLWMYKKFHPESDFALPRFDIYLMIGWFILCMTGLVGNIANTAHGIGLTIGMLCGIWQAGPQNEEGEQQARSGFEGLNIQQLNYSALAIFMTLLTVSVEYWRLGGEFFVTSFLTP